MPQDQISFYDESLKKQVEGSFVSDGWDLQVISVHGMKRIHYNDLGACIDKNAQIAMVQKTLSEMEREAAKTGSGHH